jgi:hypothetical protein
MPLRASNCQCGDENEQKFERPQLHGLWAK